MNAVNEPSNVISLAQRRQQIDIQNSGMQLQEIHRVKGLMSLRFANPQAAMHFYESFQIELVFAGKIVLPFSKFSDVPFGGPPTGTIVWVDLPNQDFIGSLKIGFKHASSGYVFSRTSH